MMKHAFAPLAFAAAIASLAGCDSHTAAERINEAMPLASEAQSARTRLVEAMKDADPAARADFEAQLDTRMKLRAVECAGDYEPGMFDDQQNIAVHFAKDHACFAAKDAALATWLGERRLGALLAAGPLRPVPAKVETYIATGPIVHVDFATKSGVGIITSRGGDVHVVDLGTGADISTASAPEKFPFESVGSMSPNGRLYGIDQADGARVMDAATGEQLVFLPGVSGTYLQWVNDVGVVLVRKAIGSDKPRVYFKDLATGLETTLEVPEGDFGRIVPEPGKTDRFLVTHLYHPSHEMVLAKTPKGWTARVEGQFDAVGMTGNPQESLTSDGRALLDARGPWLERYDLAKRDMQRIPVGPFQPIVAFPLADPDQVLLWGSYADAPGHDIEGLVYSIAGGTAAVVEREPSRAWVAWIPPMHALVEIDGKVMRAVKTTPAQPLADLATVATARQQAVIAKAQAELERQRMLTGFGAEAGMAAPGAMATIPGPVLELGKTARVLALGVYEGKRYPGDGRGGTVRVNVMRTKGPVILVLASYEGVHWVVTTDPGANVGAILLSSYEDSQVLGSQAPQYRIGKNFSYGSDNGGGNRAGLERDVQRWTGKGFDSFKGTYTGDQFFIRE